MDITSILKTTGGEKIAIEDGKLQVPDKPVIPFIEGDGIGIDIWPATRKVVDAAVEKVYEGTRRLIWTEVLAGQKAFDATGEWLPQKTIDTIREFIVAIKGPLTTPVGGGIRSLNVAIRQILDLYACVRPVRYFKGTPSPVIRPDLLNVVIFRENTEDVYAGIEWQCGSEEAKKIMVFLKDTLGVSIRPDSGIGIKPVSETGSKRLVRKAIDYAVANSRSSVTLMHKGNIMKYTEGAFRDWGYELARDEYPEVTISEDEVWDKFEGVTPERKIMVKDRISDSMFQQILTRTAEYGVIATTNLNGDYLSDACAAQVGGIGMAPGANIGDYIGVFEATHGTAPKYAGKNMANPSSLILSGSMMLDYLGWHKAGDMIRDALGCAIESKRVTYDLERLMEGATKLGTSEFADVIIDEMITGEA